MKTNKMIEVAYIDSKGKQRRYVVAESRMEAWWAKQEEKGCEFLAYATAYRFQTPGLQRGLMAPIN